MAILRRDAARLYRYQRLSFSTCSRKSTIGLLVIPTKPLVVHPAAASRLATSELGKEWSGPLQIYNAMRKTKPRLQRGVALALIDNIENLGKTIASQLTPLPVVTPDLTDDLPEAEVLEYEEPEPAEEDEVDLPPELQPQPMDDGITWHDPEHAIHDDFEETPEILAALKECADYDPNIYPEMVKECGASVLKQTLDEYDAVDMKNCGNWSRREDPEAPFFTRDDYAWLKADIQECSQGAVPKLYKRLNVPSNIIRDVIVSEDYTDLPLSSSSPLASYLFLHYVPQSRPCGHKRHDREFGKIFERMAYLMSDEDFRRNSCFKLQGNSSSLARWLVVQEFMKLSSSSQWLALKKREAEYWWRKNGWDGVLVEFFMLQEG